ncbi:helix-turn-helix transcriptional regulator [Streptomyces sedi]|uniref:WYL domain-containing protein n=1 Tax=Streptomyces sedi TaxID=555059 RepID=A0A5C4V6L5_9ACTN|nr:WYL domain-containing protein [Streptomyces sedi]TNM31096.1 WYL domain-containing protein [Streptomyces sedi]
MRAARLIRLVLLLQSRRSMTAGELAAELEVSERTIVRDVASLSEAGVPVYADRGRVGGYRLVGGYRTRLTGLGRDEAEALFLSGVPSALRDMGLADTASAARLKVSAALLPELRDAEHSAAQRFHLDAPHWWQAPETPEALPSVAEAVWGEWRMSANYRRGDGSTATRTWEPHGLILKAGAWYLAARPVCTETHRIYRVARFSDVTVEEEHFARDPDFDLPAFWAGQAAAFARAILRETVRLRLSENGAGRLRHHTDRAAAREALAGAEGPDERGWITVTLAVESADVAYEQLLALGPEAEVLEPAALRARLARSAAALATLYATGADADRANAADGERPPR